MSGPTSGANGSPGSVCVYPAQLSSGCCPLIFYSGPCKNQSDVTKPPTMPLTDHETQFQTAPFFREARLLLDSVNAHDFDTLADLCDDDHGIVDVAPDGSSQVIRTRAEWEAWFRGLFAKLDAMNATLTSEIVEYAGDTGSEFGYSIFLFRQSLNLPDSTGHFYAPATIVWKRVSDGSWKEARWHCSVERVEWDPEPPAGAAAP